MNPHYYRTTVTAVLVLGMTACSTMPKVRTEHDAQVNFSQYRTFALLPLAATGGRLEPGVMLRVAQPAQQATRDALTGKGFAETEREKADFAVLVRGESLPQVKVTDWGYTRVGYGWRSPVYVRDLEVHDYDERTLTVEIFDTRSHQLIWTGWIKREATGEIKAEKVQEGIRRILAEFPPTPKAP